MSSEISEDRCAPIAAAIARSPFDPLPVYDLADACRAQGRIDLWQEAINAARGLPHDSHQQIHRRGRAKLLAGDWSGWLDSESRIYDPRAGYLDTEFMRHLRYETLSWNGREDISDRTILLIADGSLGDFLQMMRYVPYVARRAGRVILSVRPEAARFAREALGQLLTVTLHGTKPTIPFDLYTWLMSLPALFGELAPLLPLPFQSTRMAGGAVRYGVYLEDEQLEPILIRDHARWTPIPLITLFNAAKVVMTLSGVLTVDSAAAHLAGTLGIRTWLLLNASANARWGLGDTTPWYPTVQIIRQPREGDWASVIAELQSDARIGVDLPVASLL